ncbi:MAG: BlaI/MecI/CopY family transcriptional regulator [Pirellulales bacterium]
MNDGPRAALSDAERQTLKVLWERGPSTVREVHDQLSQQGTGWSRSTVITLLQRLEKKGYVASDKSQFAFVFRAAVSREEVMHARMSELAGELCDGQPLPLVMAFAQQHAFTPAEIDQFRRMIDALKRPSSAHDQPSQRRSE